MLGNIWKHRKFEFRADSRCKETNTIKFPDRHGHSNQPIHYHVVNCTNHDGFAVKFIPNRTNKNKKQRSCPFSPCFTHSVYTCSSCSIEPPTLIFIPSNCFRASMVFSTFVASSACHGSLQKYHETPPPKKNGRFEQWLEMLFKEMIFRVP